MLNSVEAMLEQNARWREHPWLRGAACFGGGLVLSALQIEGQMQPAVMGLIMSTRGWECCASAVGSGLGYLLFWGRRCGAGLFWVVGAFLLTLLKPGKYYLAFYLKNGIGQFARTANLLDIAGGYNVMCAFTV